MRSLGGCVEFRILDLDGSKRDTHRFAPQISVLVTECKTYEMKGMPGS